MNATLHGIRGFANMVKDSEIWRLSEMSPTWNRQNETERDLTLQEKAM